MAKCVAHFLGGQDRQVVLDSGASLEICKCRCVDLSNFFQGRIYFFGESPDRFMMIGLYLEVILRGHDDELSLVKVICDGSGQQL